MGKFCECFSCSCFSFSSPQQPPNAGPSHSTSPLSGPSTSSSSSQHPPNAGPSTSTTPPDLMSLLHQFNDIRKLHDLIKLIEDLLKNASGEKGEEGCSSQVSSYIEDGKTCLEFADKHIGKLPGEINSLDELGAETQRVLIKLLKGAGKIHWVGAALSVVGFALAKFNEMGDNKMERLEMLKRMVKLGKHVMELKEEMAEEKLIEAVECIFVGCSLCTSQLLQNKIISS